MQDPAAGDANAEVPGVLLGRGRYRVLRLLDTSDVRRLYVVRDQRLDRDVILTRFTAEIGAQEWLRRATRAATRLGDHPGLFTLLDAAGDDDAPFLVCEYADGAPLQRQLPQSVDSVLGLARQLCDALSHAHAREVCGLDLDAATIWLTTEGRIKIGDFGAGLASPATRDAAGDVRALAQLLRFLAVRVEAEPRRVLLVETLDRLLAEPESAPAGGDAVTVCALASQLARIAGPAAELRAAQSEADEAAADFFGRDRELAVLRAGLRAAQKAHGRLILLAGDPGIGKTRLTEEFARESRAAGFQVLSGRCHEGEGAPAYWPWIQILRLLARSRDVASLRAQMGAGAPDLVQMLPELRHLLPDLAATPPDSMDSEHARFRLFDAFAGFLREAARDVPLMLVLDDLHWADRPSLALLGALVRDLAGMRLLIIGTHRIAEVGPGHALSGLLTNLRREPAAELLQLRGLHERDMRRLLDVLAGSPLPGAISQGLAKESEGNPFFAGELFRHMIERGVLQFRSMWVQDADSHAFGLPEGVSAVIERRLSNLSRPCLRALEAGAVIGRSFDAALLARVTGVAMAPLLALLDEAVVARVIERPSNAGDPWRFVHALIRETLYRHLPEGGRVAAHRKVGHALEASGGPVLPVIELAHHFRQCLAADTADRVLRYSRAAGESASARFAHEEAVTHFTTAIEAAALCRDDPARRVDLRLRLADALRCAGDSERASQTYIAVADEARGAGLGPEQARAALGLGSVSFGASWWASLIADPTLLRLLREARRAVGDDHPELRARIAARISLELYCTEAWEYCTDVADEAVAYSARLGPSVAAATAAAVKCVAAVRPHNGAEHADRVRECLALGEASGSRVAVINAHVLHFFDFSTCVDRDPLDACIDGYQKLADEMREAQHLWYGLMLRAMQRMLDGDMAEAERAAAAALEIGQRAEDRNSAMIYGGQMGIIRFFQGRSAELESPFRGFAVRYPAIPGWSAALALSLAEGDRADEARIELDRFGATAFSSLRTDNLWFNAMAMFAVAALACGHAGAAQRLYDLLLPYANRYAFCPPGLGARGPIAFGLACCALMLRRYEDTARFAELAAQNARRMRDRPFEYYAQCIQGAVLAVRPARGDPARGRELILAAEASCEPLGVAPLSQRRWFRARIREIAARNGNEAAAEEALAGAGETPAARRGRRHGLLPTLRRWSFGLRNRLDQWRAAIGARVIRAVGARIRDVPDEKLERLFARPLVQWLLFTMMAGSFRPRLAFGFEGEVTYELSYRSDAMRGRDPATWTLSVKGRRARARSGPGHDPAAHIRMSVPTLLRISFGEITSVAAMVAGLTDVRGDLTLASRLVEMFGGIAPVSTSAPDLLSQQTANARTLRALLAEFDIGVPGASLREEKSEASSLLAQRPEASHAIGADGTVTLLFTDMEGFSRMTEQLGDARAHQLMQDHHRIVRSAIAEHDGYEVEVLGDGFQIAFATARKALACAVAIQHAFDDHNRLRPTQPIHVRMGVHVGEAIQERDKFFGKTVIVAFRVSALATAGEILATRAVRALTEHEGRFVFGPDRSLELKGLESRFVAASVDWRAIARPQETAAT
ncbi:AAA family ATPase [Panacagrimonas perspica]|nr:AAA family ATPase [Panacagrimonas perspica]